MPPMNGSYIEDETYPTGVNCELCHQPETIFCPQSDFFLDRDPTNVNAENRARVCPACYRHLLMAMPDGIKESRTLFAFLINRGLYSHDQLIHASSRPG